MYPIRLVAVFAAVVISMAAAAVAASGEERGTSTITCPMMGDGGMGGMPPDDMMADDMMADDMMGHGMMGHRMMRHGMMGRGMMRHGMMGPGMMGRGMLWLDVGLTEQQKQQLAELHAERARRQFIVMHDMQAPRQRLAELMAAEQLDVGAVSEAYDALARLRREAVIADLQTRRQVQDILAQARAQDSGRAQ